MIPSQSSSYRRALGGPHEAYSRVEVWRGGLQVGELSWAKRDPGAPYTREVPVFFGGSVRATLGSRVTRQLTLSVPDSLYPWGTRDLLNPYGNELRVFKGIRYGQSVDEFPVFVGRITRAKPPGKGQLQVEASDNAGLISAAGFSSPQPSQVGDLVLDEFERLVKIAYPGAVFGTHGAITATVPTLSYDQDPGTALDALATAGSAFWYVLAGGQFVMRRIPWVYPADMQPIPLTDGPGGTLATAFPDRDSANLYNRVTVVSDRPDGGPALWATAEDADPDSPTYVDGAFGRKSMSVRVTGIANQGQALSIAQSLVKRTRALTESWTISCVPDASIELGDLLAPSFRGRSSIQVVASFSMPLAPDELMTLDGRSLQLIGDV